MKKLLLSLAACLAVGFGVNAETVTDLLTPTSLGLDGSSTYKDYTYTGNSGAKYALQCSNGTQIQLRGSNPSGLVVTQSPGTVKSVKVTWNSSTAGGRQIDFYTSETAYSGPAELYSGGSVAGTLTYSNTVEDVFTFADGTKFFGLRSKSSALYLSQIEVTWETDGTTGGGGTTDPDPDPTPQGDVYTLVTSLDQLGNSAECVIAYAGANKAMGAQSGTYRTAVDATIDGNELTYADNIAEVTIAKSGNNYTFQVADGYLSAPSSASNAVSTVSELADACYATIVMTESGDATITFNASVNNKVLQYNTSSPRFACYTGTQKAVQIYMKGESTGGGDTPVEPTPGGETVNVTYDTTAQGYGNAEDITSWTGDGVTIDFANGGNSNGPKYYTSGTAIRIYPRNTMTVSVPEGGLISEITIGFGTSDGTNEITVNGGNWTSPNWTGSANSVVFTVGGSSGNRRIQTVTVTYTTGEAPAVLTPQITCENNVVTMTCATAGAEIYYTTNGSEPSKASNKYSTPINISQTTNFKARAYVGEEASSVASYTATYVGMYQGFEAFIEAGANTEGTIAGPMTAIYQSGQYLYVIDNEDYPMLVYGTVNQTLNNGDEIANIKGKYSPYNGLPEVTNPVLGTITTGGTPVAPNTITADQIPNIVLNSYVEIKNLMFTGELTMEDSEGNVVTLYKRFNEVTIPTDQNKKYDVIGVTSIFGGTYQVYPISFEEVVSSVEQVATPVFDPEGGEVEMGSTVTITCATDGATIYYTVNGDTPSTESNLYSAPIAINEAQTIKAIAVKDGMDNSFIATATYTVFDPNAVSEMFDFSDPTSLNPTNGNTVEIPENGTGYTVAGFTFQEGDAYVIISEQVGNTPPRLWAATGASEGQIDLRVYTGEYFIVRVDGSQYHLTGIEFTKEGGNFDMTPNVGTLTKSGSNASWTPASAQGASMRAESGFISDVQFDITGTTRISTIKVTYTDGAGDVTTEVIEIEAANESDAVYYNLQGVRVQNPERGIYVKVVNGKATKVLR